MWLTLIFLKVRLGWIVSGTCLKLFLRFQTYFVSQLIFVYLTNFQPSFWNSFLLFVLLFHYIGPIIFIFMHSHYFVVISLYDIDILVRAYMLNTHTLHILLKYKSVVRVLLLSRDSLQDNSCAG